MANSFPYHQIEEYLQGDLQGEELKLFEQLLEEDESFKKELELYKSIRGAVNDEGLNELESKLKSAEKKYFDSTNKNKTIRRSLTTKWFWRISTAAIIGLLIWAGIKLFEILKQP